MEGEALEGEPLEGQALALGGEALEGEAFDGEAVKQRKMNQVYIPTSLTGVDARTLFGVPAKE